MTGKKKDKKTAKLVRALADQWTEFITDRVADANATDIGDTIYQVIRESYTENLEDLHFYAEKVRFFNKLKKTIRAELTRARQTLGRQSISTGRGTADDSIETYMSVWFDAFPSVDEDGKARVITHDALPLETRGALQDYICELEEKLATVGDDAQLANIDLQNNLQKVQQTLQTLSTVSKMIHDTSMSIIRKLG